ncbi:hypothetical protein [Engelhardtia mirabilis]|uniref:Uncharacterized protein n=1 Tax=Engelhardtia mirabilis TaxID=2528011 RepID=A0A518BR35_9BACT|nr:hypothetical protein Pla133_45300 [Planctomycetes bacterium Pla133]QDV03736.1 hypothetical protein Pla86_45280 [Planctomycetes bacterium Pla86]
MLRSLTLVAAVVAVAPASASDFEIKILSGGLDTLNVSPGQQVSFDLVGELCDANNLGLAAFRIDLTFDGGDLAPLGDPGGQPLANFASPLGLSNPAGYGGTPIGGDLIQIGGAQNTINQFFAPKPAGTVMTSVAHPGSALVLGSGTLTAPAVPGTYTVSVVEAGANVIAQTTSGVPFWEVEAAGVMVHDLTLTVDPALTVDTASISLSAGGSAGFALDAGAANAGRVYLMLGSVTGSSPATTVGGLDIPLVIDAYTLFTLANPTAPPLIGALGFLDGQGAGTAGFSLPAGSDPALAGIDLHHAYLLPLPVLDFASNAVSFSLVP